MRAFGSMCLCICVCVSVCVRAFVITLAGDRMNHCAEDQNCAEDHNCAEDYNCAEDHNFWTSPLRTHALTSFRI